MSKLLKMTIAAAVVAAGMMFAAPSDAKAQGFSLRFGGRSYGGYSYAGHSYAPQRRSSLSFYYGSPTYGSYFATPRYNFRGHGGGHYDYHPGHFDWHNGHYDWHPGHYDWHDTHHDHGFHGHRGRGRRHH